MNWSFILARNTLAPVEAASFIVAVFGSYKDIAYDGK
jgi:hypothetical protein